MDLLIGRNHCCPLFDGSALAEKIPFSDVTVEAVLLLKTLLGALGNFPILCRYLLHNCTEGQVRTIDLIFMHLTLSNSLVILSKGVPYTIAAFGLEHVFSDVGCHLLSYIRRVGRGVSIGTTCLMSVFQAIMISPVDSIWKDLKVKVPKYVTISIFLCWIFYILVHLFLPLHTFYVSSEWNLENITRNKQWAYCYVVCNENASVPVYIALILFPEIVFSTLIVWGTGSMILFLHRHKQRVQHLHRNQVSSRSLAETRVTQRILVLVSTFVCFYTLSSFFNICVVLFHDQNRLLSTAAGVISLCFPIVSPFLLTRRDPIVSRQSFDIMLNRRSNDHSRNKKHIF